MHWSVFADWAQIQSDETENWGKLKLLLTDLYDCCCFRSGFFQHCHQEWTDVLLQLQSLKANTKRWRGPENTSKQAQPDQHLRPPWKTLYLIWGADVLVSCRSQHVVHVINQVVVKDDHVICRITLESLSERVFMSVFVHKLKRLFSQCEDTEVRLQRQTHWECWTAGCTVQCSPCPGWSRWGSGRTSLQPLDSRIWCCPAGPSGNPWKRRVMLNTKSQLVFCLHFDKRKTGWHDRTVSKYL